MKNENRENRTFTLEELQTPKGFTAARKYTGLSQEQTAKQLDCIQRTISNYETGKTKIRPQAAQRMLTIVLKKTELGTPLNREDEMMALNQALHDNIALSIRCRTANLSPEESLALIQRHVDYFRMSRQDPASNRLTESLQLDTLQPDTTDLSNDIDFRAFTISTEDITHAERVRNQRRPTIEQAR